MIVGSRLEIPKMAELSHVRVTQEERHISVAIINSIQSLSFEELINVVFNDWALSHSTNLGSCGLSFDSVSPGKNVFESFVL